MTNRSSRSAYLFIAFPLTIIFVFTALPTLAGIGLSFFEWQGGGQPRFIGLENYRAVLADDPQFRYALRNTLIFTAVSVPLSICLAFLLAVAMNATWFIGKTVTRTVFFLPTVASIVAIGFIWQWVLDPQAGLLNFALRSVGLDVLFGGELPTWLGDSPWALVAIILVQVWRHVGFCIVLYLAALTQVPRSLYEAAAVDGAAPWQMTWRITWPCVRPMTIFLVITGAIWALQVFDLVWVMTGAAEQRWTDVLNAHLVREFNSNRLGYAATIGVFVLLLTVAVTLTQLRWLRVAEEAS